MSPKRPWSESDAVEVWKHFANIGGVDKNRMVTVTTWLLGFSGVILWYLVTEELTGWEVREPRTAGILAVVGMIDSILAGIVVRAYAGYANRNWAMADALAESYGWIDLHPEKAGPIKAVLNRELEKAKPGWIVRSAWHAAEPHNPQKHWAPIFVWFFFLSLLAWVAHAIFFGLSVCG